ncbi:uncharacterized protein LOC134191041 [Corticium candelabrum]|uniref:uncharacterized protein LOC134191041 n=1 Tax=Corticium candelabrum TaxID=121492 RepID=UPI002E25879D|nr:uncharacterized protein LOC134191041 [Corticium candelabrum]
MMYSNAAASFLLVAATYTELLSSHLASARCASAADLGKTECHLMYEFSTFQWATCVTEDYMHRISSSRSKSRECPDTAASQCFFPCMSETLDIDNGTVTEPCFCAGTAAPPSDDPPLPPSCFSPAGDSCEWYRDCLEARYNCSTTRYDYAIGYGKRFCDLYGKHYNELGPVAREWVDATRKCLQVDLVPYLRPWVNISCLEIYNNAFRTHTGCYLSPQAGAPSICHLPCNDLWKIFWLVSFQGGALLSEPIETARQMIQVAAGCLDKERREITCLPETVQRLVYIGVTGERLMSILDTAERIRDFSGALVHALAMKFGWNERGLGWMPFTHHNSERPSISKTDRYRRADLESNDDTQSESLNVQILMVDRFYLNSTQLEPSSRYRRVGTALFELASSLNRDLIGNLTIPVVDQTVTVRVSELGHCFKVGCNSTESYVITTGTSSASTRQSSMFVLLIGFILFS